MACCLGNIPSVCTTTTGLGLELSQDGVKPWAPGEGCHMYVCAEGWGRDLLSQLWQGQCVPPIYKTWSLTTRVNLRNTLGISTVQTCGNLMDMSQV